MSQTPKVHGLMALALFSFCLAAGSVRASDPATTIAESEQVLTELIAIPGRQIPEELVRKAEAVAIIPRVIKIGFVAGVRRGQGVLLIRDADGQWGLPRFITLTGGSVGWQAGVQGTDVVLVFTTRRSVERLMNGKFTIGVDAAAAAGPVGRNASAATDLNLQAEILSYSRSRGLFLGASVDGSAIEINQDANRAYYGTTNADLPQVVPQAAMQLQAFVNELTAGSRVVPVNGQPIATVDGAPAGGQVLPATAITPVRVEALRRSLVESSGRLAQLLNPEWEQYLALPRELQNPADGPDLTALEGVFERFQLVSTDPQYRDLASRPEFQTTMELLREYIDETRVAMPTLVLPPPPGAGVR